MEAASSEFALATVTAVTETSKFGTRPVYYGRPRLRERLRGAAAVADVAAPIAYALVEWVDGYQIRKPIH